MNSASLRYRWRWGRFLLRQGDLEAALPEIGRVVRDTPRYRPSALRRLYDREVSAQTLLSVWPTEPAARILLLQFLIEKSAESEQWIELMPVLWEALLDGDPPPTAQRARPYLTYLMGQGRHEEARRNWALLQSVHGRRDGCFDGVISSGANPPQNLVWNGDFEMPLQGGLFDWQLADSHLYSIDRQAAPDGDWVLRLVFEGKENLAFNGLRQQVVVAPARDMRLSFRVKTQGLTTKQRPFFQMVDRDTGQLLMETEPFQASSPWEQYEYSFRTRSTTRLVSLRLLRRESRRIDSKIRGTVWLDSVRLQVR